MPISRGTVDSACAVRVLTAGQAGAVSRRQLLEWGWTSEEIQGQVRARRWTRIHRGIYWTATGPPPRGALLWAAILGSGEGAVLSGPSAAEAWGFGPQSDLIHVAVPRKVRPRRLKGVRVNRVSNVERRADRRMDPPRTTVEDTVLDLVSSARSDLEAVGWLTRALQARKTYPKRLLAASLERPRLRRRAIVEATCGCFREGATTPLEIGWLRNVERPHGLPRARRQVRGVVAGRTVFRDLGYPRFGLFIELDGRLGHEGAEGAFRDMRRDNAAAVEGRSTLRYGWTSVMSTPCEVALQVAAALTLRGWAGQLEGCGVECLARAA